MPELFGDHAIIQPPLESLCKQGGLSKGMHNQRLDLSCGRQVQVRTYTLGCPVPPQYVKSLLLDGHCAEALRDCKSLHICVLWASEEVPAKASGNQPPEQPQLEAPVAPRIQPSLPTASQKSVLRRIKAIGLGMGCYTKVRPVAKGTHGIVYEVKRQDGTQFAQKEVSMKKISRHGDFPERVVSADRQIRALKKLAWASCVVVPVVDAWIQSDLEQAVIVMEWLPFTLEKVLSDQRSNSQSTLLPSLACRWLTQMVMGLAVIHSEGFIHRRIKPTNILITAGLKQCKIADLGLGEALHRVYPRQEGLKLEPSFVNPADSVDEDSAGAAEEGEEGSMVSSKSPSLSKTSVVSSGFSVSRSSVADYTSPEALNDNEYDLPMDVFSLGCVLFEILTLKRCDELHLGAQTRKCSPAGRAVELLKDVPAKAGSCEQDRLHALELRKLCVWTLASDPQGRPSAREMAAREFLQSHVEVLIQQCSTLKQFLPLLPGSPKGTTPAPARQYAARQHRSRLRSLATEEVQDRVDAHRTSSDT